MVSCFFTYLDLPLYAYLFVQVLMPKALRSLSPSLTATTMLTRQPHPSRTKSPRSPSSNAPNPSSTFSKRDNAHSKDAPSDGADC